MTRIDCRALVRNRIVGNRLVVMAAGILAVMILAALMQIGADARRSAEKFSGGGASPVAMCPMGGGETTA